jgi:uncharacterized protein (TIGR01777 family)
MKVVITGSSGFVGQELKNMFQGMGYSVIGIKREQLHIEEQLIEIIDKSDIVINLAGANIIARWSNEYKKELYESRIDTTSALVNVFEKVENKPKLFISTSAVGIYNNQGNYSEDDMEYAKDFLGNLCIDWEAEALGASDLGIRTVVFRYGIVLGKNGGALKQMLLPFKLGVGGKIGSGEQGFSFIHLEDLKNAYQHIINNNDLEGIFNLTAPVPTTNLGLTKALGKSLKRPTFLPLPEFVLELIFSEGAKVLTDGQKVIPKRLIDSGFEFTYTNIEEAIENLVK